MSKDMSPISANWAANASSMAAKPSSTGGAKGSPVSGASTSWNSTSANAESSAPGSRVSAADTPVVAAISATSCRSMAAAAASRAMRCFSRNAASISDFGSSTANPSSAASGLSTRVLASPTASWPRTLATVSPTRSILKPPCFSRSSMASRTACSRLASSACLTASSPISTGSMSRAMGSISTRSSSSRPMMSSAVSWPSRWRSVTRWLTLT